MAVKAVIRSLSSIIHSKKSLSRIPHIASINRTKAVRSTAPGKTVLINFPKENELNKLATPHLSAFGCRLQ
jgi:hypothetical protein